MKQDKFSFITIQYMTLLYFMGSLTKEVGNHFSAPEQHQVSVSGQGLQLFLLHTSRGQCADYQQHAGRCVQ